MEKALVTGGAGFIGSNIAEELVEKDVQVVVLDNLYLGTKNNLKEIEDQIKFIEGSVNDKETVKKALKGCDTVFHQAAKSSAPMHNEDPENGAKVNINGFINVVEAAKNEESMEKVVYASTSSMYGSVEPPHREDMGEEPLNLYTATKMSRELYANVYSETTTLQFTGLRYFSVFGPHEKAKGKYANIVSQFIWKMLEGKSPVIFGDGTQTRDFTYVKDVARANILAAERKEKTNGEYYNIGTGKETSFNEVIEKLQEVLEKEIDAENVENPIENYVARTRADIQKAEQELGFKPQYSFDEGVRKTVEYYKRHL